jgi:hypothetical protein
VRISISKPGAVTDIEPNTNMSLVDLVTVTLDMADTMNVLSTYAFPHVQDTVYWTRGLTFSTIERKEPAFTTCVTIIDPEVAIPVNMEDGISVILVKNTILEKEENKSKTNKIVQLNTVFL